MNAEKIDLLTANRIVYNGGEVFRNVFRSGKSTYDRFFYQIRNDVLICRVNEYGCWAKAVAPLLKRDVLYRSNEQGKYDR